MANRLFRKIVGFINSQVDCHFKFAISAAGAVGTITPGTAAFVVKSIVKQGTAGQYIVTLVDAWPDIMDLKCALNLLAGVVAQSVTVIAYSATPASGGSTFTIQVFNTNTGAAADAASGSEIHVSITTHNSKLAIP